MCHFRHGSSRLHAGIPVHGTCPALCGKDRSATDPARIPRFLSDLPPVRRDHSDQSGCAGSCRPVPRVFLMEAETQIAKSALPVCGSSPGIGLFLRADQREIPPVPATRGRMVLRGKCSMEPLRLLCTDSSRFASILHCGSLSPLEKISAPAIDVHCGVSAVPAAASRAFSSRCFPCGFSRRGMHSALT